MLKTLKASVAVAGLVAGGHAFAAEHESLSGDLVIFSDMSNPAPRAVMEGLVAEFGEMHPDLNIELTVIDREAYKTQIRNFLTANAPDVANWYAGNRMAPYVDAGLFMDVSDIWEGEMSENLASTKSAMTMDDKQWGVPYTYYQWGVYYRADLYDEYGLEEPQDWETLKSNCQTLLDNGIKCFTIGTKFLWTAGGWFDYLNMRTNGYDYHMQLTAGEIPWTDDGVRQTFANWRELIDMGAFVDNHTAYSWQEALPFMVNGDAAAYLMGNFAVAPLREAGLSDDQLDYYQFPAINPDVELAEDAPTDTFHVPAQASNPEAGKAFLKYVTSPEVQTWINASDALGQLPVNSQASVGDDKFLQQGFEVLSSNAPGGVAQFFDRDAPAEMAKVAMEGFQQFMVQPDQLDNILQRLEQAAGRIYDK
ncbi:ABC transporter substrate-binding protein [Palleronia pelagia]|uniref:Carbohydrate ABC transporter substrate-binding protein, CUT1 family (TC 3.A.1.1.-) n=1 Tax=Palleronia pelagia TaxID=387096 RepID=A0A1H8H7Q8_9RHOB|nr:ABC transporter substrate-binding protein [Palleronia pelagia]SEN52069.1 carbohydrate ABC transporter substrate-binding protein, CUT1 family (TC 3.A.1.1.-) [Palleronia pelagia]